MAKKKKLSWADIADAGNPSWVLESQRTAEQKQNKEREVAAQVDAIVKDYESRGEPLNDREIASLFQAMTNGEDWTRPANFEGTVGGASSTEEDYVEPSPQQKEIEGRTGLAGYLANTADLAKASYTQGAAVSGLAGIESEEGTGLGNAAVGAFAKINPYTHLLAAVSGKPANEVAHSLADAVSGAYKDAFFGRPTTASWDPVAAYMQDNLITPEQRQAQMAAHQVELDKKKAQLQGDLDRASTTLKSLEGSVGPVTETLVGAPASFAGQPEQILPTIGALAGSALGGPAGSATGATLLSLPMANTAYVQAKNQAIQDFNANRDEAEWYGLAMAATEVGSEAAGGPLEAAAAGVAERIGLKSLTKDAAKDALLKRIRSRTERVLAQAGVEGGEEVVGTAAQDAIEKGMEVTNFFDSPEGQEALREHNLENAATWGERYAKAFGGGAVVGGIIGTPTAIAATNAEKKQRRQTLERALSDTRNDINVKRGNELLRQAQEQDKADTETTQDIAFEQQRIADEEAKQQAFEQAEKTTAEQKELEEEAGFQTLERANTPAATVVERTGRAGLADVVERVPAEPVRPEDVAEQRAAEQRAREEQQEQVRKEKLTNTLRKEQERRAKAQEKEIKKQSRAERLAADKRAREVAGQILDENPNASPEELTDELDRRLAEPVEEATDDLEQRPVEGATAPVQEQPTVSDKELTEDDKKLGDLVDALNLSLGSASNEADAASEEPKARRDARFRSKGKGFIKALVDRSHRQDSTDLQNLLVQGKVVVGLSPSDLGRAENNNAAEFDLNTGKMYLYLDKLGNMDNAVGHIAKAVHEANHALLTPEQVKAASTKLRTAAKNGNKHAQWALDQAQRDTKNRDGDNTYEDEELVAYFAERTKNSDRGVLGTVGGTLRDIVSNARQGIRNLTGLDLDITPGEIATALHGALGDATTREITGRSQAGQLGTLAGRGSTGFAQAEAQGRTFTPTSDRAGGPRFEFDDSGAELNDDWSVWDSLATGTNDAVPLNELMSHPELERQYPDLFNSLAVTVDPDMPFSVHGSYYNGWIFLPRSVMGTVRMRPEDLRNTMLHEIQHAIQEKEGFVPGANKESFIPTAIAEMKKLDEERVDQLASSFELGAAIKGLNPTDRAAWDALDKSMPGLPIDQVSAMFIQEGYHNKTSDRNAQRQGNRFLQAQENLKKTNAEYRDAERRGFNIYLRDRGEAEARNVETRSRMTQAERDALPFESTIGQDIGVTPDELLDTTPFVGRPERAPVASESLGMAVNSDGSINKNEMRAMDNAVEDNKPNPQSAAWKRFIGNSITKTKDGGAKVLYRGTNSLSPFTSFTYGTNELGVHIGPLNIAKMFMNLSGGRIYPLYARMENPVRIDEDPFAGAAPKVLDALLTAPELKGADSTYVKEDTAEAWRAYEDAVAYVNSAEEINSAKELYQRRAFDVIRKFLLNNGIDSVEYTNYQEDPTGKSKSWVVLEPDKQLKSAVANTGEYSAHPSSGILGSAAVDSDSDKFSVPLRKRLAGLLSHHAFTSEDIGEALEYAKSSPAEQRLLAAGYGRRFEAAVEKLAEEQGVDRQVIVDNIIKDLDAVDKKSDVYSENLANFKRAASKYGAAGDALIEFRNLIDDLSMAALQARAELAKKGQPLTEKERKAYQAIVSNLGRYSHRQFAVNFAGANYAKQVLKDYRLGKKKGEDSLTDAQRKNYDRMANGVARIAQDILIPDDAGLAELDGESVDALYDVWGESPTPEAVSHEDKLEELARKRDKINGDEDLINKEAEIVAKEILGFSSKGAPGLMAAKVGGNTVDRSILQKRKNIPEEIRELMGEITDPSQRLFTTVAKLAEFNARNNMLTEIAGMNAPEHIQPPGLASRPEVEGMVRLKGEAYGALQGHYVSHNLHGLLSGTIEQLATFDQAVAVAAGRPDFVTNKLALAIFDAWKYVAGVTKARQIIGKPFNFLMNVMGGGRTMLSNGNINPVHLGKAVKTAGALIRNSVDPNYSTPESRRVTAAGVTDSAFIGELTHEEHKKLVAMLDEMVGLHPSKWGKYYRRAKAFSGELYSMMDVVYKIAGFYQQADAVLPEFYKANGDNLTQKEIDRRAANITNRTYVTYKRAVPLAKMLERGGFTMFGTFFTEVIRTDVNGFIQAINELEMADNAKTPEAKRIMQWQAARRIAGIATTWSMTAAVARGLASAAFGDDEDKESKLRAMLADFAQDQDLLPVGRDENGHLVLMNVSLFDPAGPLSDVLRSAINGDADARSMAQNVFDLYVAPRVGTRLGKAIGVSMGWVDGGVGKPVSQQLFPELYDDVLRATSLVTNPVTQQPVEDRTVKAWTSVGETFLPGVYGAWRETNPSPEIKDPLSLVANVMRWGGATLYSLDPVKGVQGAYFDYSDTVSNSKKRLSELPKDRSSLTEADILTKLIPMQQAEKRAYDKVYKIVQGMDAMGMSSREITLALEAAGVKSSDVNKIKSGKFVPSTVLSKRSLDNLEKKELKNSTREEQGEVKNKWKKIKEMFKNASAQAEETD